MDPRRSSALFPALAALLAAGLPYLPAQAPPAAPAPERLAELRAHVGFLAGDELEGRWAATPHIAIAGRYVATRFASFGLKQVAEGGTSWFYGFRARSGRCRNVLGLVEGTDPELRREVIVVGAHYDHIGVLRRPPREGERPTDRINNGADDNASGTAGMLSLARAFALEPAPRSILFMAFSAEEQGLMGSRAYVEDTVAMVNLDMIGRSEDGYLFVGGVGTSPVWSGLIERHVAPAGFRLELAEGGRAPTDSTSFYAKDIPVLFFFTHIHEDYHRPSDLSEKVQYETQARIVTVAEALLRELAAMPERPAFQAAPSRGMPADFMERMAAMVRRPRVARDTAEELRRRPPSEGQEGGAGQPGRPRAGLSLAMESPDGPVVVRAVAEGSPAAAAGLEAGDRILAVDGRPLEDAAGLARALRAARPGERLVLRVRRGEEEQELTLAW